MLTQENPDFSVIITAYNKEEFVGEAIQSVLNQSFQGFEIIAIDDGSTDNTKNVIFSFSDPRIRYAYQENSGLPACARNKGMSLSKGKYIALLDGDDFWHKDKLSNCKRILDNAPETWVLCHNVVITENNKIMRYTDFGRRTNKMYRKLLFQGNCLGPSAVVLRRDIFFVDKIRFSEDRAFFTVEDYEYWLRLAERYPINFISDVLGYYRITDRGVFFRNIDVNTYNMLKLLDAHFNKTDNRFIGLKQKMKRRRSSVMCAAGRMYHHQGNFTQAKEWYRKAIAEYPFNYKAHICFLAVLLNKRIAYR